ncbi:DUF397 domain-containing protein [Saccharopolyspora spinosa]|uniref:Uncharacterized protein DUF397 n=1 Tax=Saccharopolyspora spinosa TaxID=60894 RepID=A0A2N3Y6H8_SACSN|nr:DUF397 domain-containing protein [Saccharopolyspora spinosa]PKW18471.1 uncharacterized protein DUF397 [Saccharopolyspora spinosa]
MSVSHTTPSGWRKSSRSTNTDNCVEVGSIGDGAAVRDTKNRATGYFTANREQWSAFVAAFKGGKFDA